MLKLPYFLICTAYYKGHTSIVELLLNNADALHLDLIAKTFWLGKTGFQEAQSKGHSDVVELIRAKRPSIAEQRVPRVWVEFENRYILSNGTTNLCPLPLLDYCQINRK